MTHKIFRKSVRTLGQEPLFSVLILEKDRQYALFLKHLIEARLRAAVTIARSSTEAMKLLKESPNHFFIGVTNVPNGDASDFKKIDMLCKFDLPLITIVSNYDDELRDQLIKRHVIDYVVKNNNTEANDVCDVIERVYKNSHIKVLVADDSVVSRFVIARELAVQKFQVIHAKNGQEALDILAEQSDIQLVLVDQQMPTIDGVTFVQMARERYAKDALLIIGLSTSIDPKLSVKFLKAGANDFISKPFNYEILLCRINQNLDMLDTVRIARQVSHKDSLSGLHNRRYFFEQGNKLVNNLAANQRLSVMMVDIDNFREINDLHGHEAGDVVIKNVAARLKESFADDIVARIGGEEFAVLSTQADIKAMQKNLEAFRLNVQNQSITLGAVKLKYTCSIGVCCEAANSLDDMVAHADKKLYEAKCAGKNQVSGQFS